MTGGALVRNTWLIRGQCAPHAAFASTAAGAAHTEQQHQIQNASLSIEK